MRIRIHNTEKDHDVMKQQKENFCLKKIKPLKRWRLNRTGIE
jgi:hypothetical protein